MRLAPLASVAPLWSFIPLLLLLGNTIAPSAAFAPPGYATSTSALPTTNALLTIWRSHHPQSASRGFTALFESEGEEEPTTEAADDDVPTSPAAASGPILQRFLSPRIDDPGLPLTDVLLAQIVAPTLQIYWLLLNRAPNPSWLRPVSTYFGEAPELAPRGSLLAPTLIHGAGLAVCWLAGALAARSYEREAFSVKKGGAGEEGDARGTAGAPSSVLDAIARYDTILVRLFQAGAFASGVLILSTQLDLLLEFKGYVQYGESSETDLRLLVATADVINDVVWEALVMGSWRIIHANFMSTPLNRQKRF